MIRRVVEGVIGILVPLLCVSIFAAVMYFGLISLWPFPGLK